jgi:IS5 family transposase
VIAVNAAIRAESADLRIRIDGRGNVLTCRLDGDPANLFATLRRSRDLLPAVRTLVPVLVRTGLRLDVLAGNLRVASAGSGVRQNALARLLRIPAAHVGM